MTSNFSKDKTPLEITDPYQLAKYIKEASKSTFVKVYLNGTLDRCQLSNVKWFGEGSFNILMGEYDEIMKILDLHKGKIVDYYIECDRRNSAIPLLDIKNIDARIEPGAIIRDKVYIGRNAIIMMGAIINIGAEIGDNTMIDMNVVVGARGIIGKNVHVGAGTVIAGVLEPPSNRPVIIEDDVVIGANVVVLEGMRIGKGAVVAAGAVVTKNVPPNTVVAGIPAKIIKQKDSKTVDKVKILDDLRG